MVNLNCIKLATKEDKQYQIDSWASLFKAQCWTREDYYRRQRTMQHYLEKAEQRAEKEAMQTP